MIKKLKMKWNLSSCRGFIGKSFAHDVLGDKEKCFGCRI